MRRATHTHHCGLLLLFQRPIRKGRPPANGAHEFQGAEAAAKKAAEACCHVVHYSPLESNKEARAAATHGREEVLYYIVHVHMPGAFLSISSDGGKLLFSIGLIVRDVDSRPVYSTYGGGQKPSLSLPPFSARRAASAASEAAYTTLQALFAVSLSLLRARSPSSLGSKVFHLTQLFRGNRRGLAHTRWFTQHSRPLSFCVHAPYVCQARVCVRLSLFKHCQRQRRRRQPKRTQTRVCVLCSGLIPESRPPV